MSVARPIDPRTLLPKDEVFSHIDDVTGEVRHFHIGTLEKLWVTKSYGVCPIVAPIEEDMVDFIRKQRGIEQHRLDRLKEPYLSKPIFAAKFPDDTVLIMDGHHRYVRRHEVGIRFIHVALFLPNAWEQSLVDVPDFEGLPEQSGL